MAVKLYLSRVIGITAEQRVHAESLTSDDVFSGADLVTSNYWLGKPRIGDTVLILRDGNRDYCIGLVVTPTLLTAIEPGDLRIPTGHYMRSEDHQEFGTPPLPTSWLHTH